MHFHRQMSDILKNIGILNFFIFSDTQNTGLETCKGFLQKSYLIKRNAEVYFYKHQNIRIQLSIVGNVRVKYNISFSEI